MSAVNCPMALIITKSYRFALLAISLAIHFFPTFISNINLYTTILISNQYHQYTFLYRINSKYTTIPMS